MSMILVVIITMSLPIYYIDEFIEIFDELPGTKNTSGLNVSTYIFSLKRDITQHN